ncbi:MAG: hypothetical protein IKB15_05020 [Alistipes sp.]|nr:hypothetical protein [Alistipes sp.]
MRQLITLFIALMGTATLYAQQPYKVYCTLSALHKGASVGSLSRVEVDYGQDNNTKNYLVDEYGKAINYRSVTAAANDFAKLGWELETSYVVGDDNIRCVWIMSKMVIDDSEITEGFKTRWMLENGY